MSKVLIKDHFALCSYDGTPLDESHQTIVSITPWYQRRVESLSKFERLSVVELMEMNKEKPLSSAFTTAEFMGVARKSLSLRTTKDVKKTYHLEPSDKGLDLWKETKKELDKKGQVRTGDVSVTDLFINEHTGRIVLKQIEHNRSVPVSDQVLRDLLRKLENKGVLRRASENELSRDQRSDSRLNAYVFVSPKFEQWYRWRNFEGGSRQPWP